MFFEKKLTEYDDDDDDDYDEEESESSSENEEEMRKDLGKYLHFPSRTGALSQVDPSVALPLNLPPAPVQLAEGKSLTPFHVVIRDDPTPPILRKLVMKRELANRRRQRMDSTPATGAFARVSQSSASSLESISDSSSSIAKRQRH